jgi:hypothetical protein
MIRLKCVEPFLPIIDITMGDEVPVYSRASLSRTAATAVALFLMAISAGAVARAAVGTDVRHDRGSLSAQDRKILRESALRSSLCMRGKWRDLEERSRKQAELAGVADFDRKPFEAAMAGINARAQRDRAAAQLIE